MTTQKRTADGLRTPSGPPGRELAVICARPPEQNTGMLTVDLAAASVLPRLFPDHDVRLYITGELDPTHSYAAANLPFQYLNVFENETRFFASDRFLFWGDFFHSRSYYRNDIGAWDGMDAEAQAEAFAAQSRIFFLSDLPEAQLAKAGVFGTTLITNSTRDMIDAQYKTAFDRFFSNVQLALFRDAISASRLQPLRQNQPTLGCDCAFLLEDADLDKIDGFTRAATREGIGLFLRRTPKYDRSLRFARALGRELGESVKWLPWFWSRRRLALQGQFRGIDVETAQPSAGEILSQMSGFRFIVTDTYHLCINAWRMGIPAVCIGSALGHQSNSLSDKKKEILYTMYRAQEFYLFSEALSDGSKINAAAKAAAGALRNEELVAHVRANMEDHRLASHAQLATFAANDN